MRLLSILLLVSGCYCSHRVDDDDDTDRTRDGSLPDGELADGEVPMCSVVWGSCRLAWTGSAAATADMPSAPDVALLPNGDVGVVYRDGDQTFFARFDGSGEVLDETELGNLGDARLAVHPTLGAVVAGERALRWLSPTFEPVGDVTTNRPMGGEAFGVDVAAVPDGFLLFAIPGGPGDPPALQAVLTDSPATPSYEAFASVVPLQPFEHAEDGRGFATHVGFESSPGNVPVAFEVGESSVGDNVGVGEGRGTTTFIDGVASYRGRVFLYFQGFSATLVELGDSTEVFQRAEAEGTGNNGHISSLGDDRLVLFFTETDGRVVARPWRPGGSVGGGMQLAAPDGLRTRDIRSAPTPRGLLATWECADGICAAAIECCPE